ncbi:MAG: monovalent cation/H+ antiporter subunit E [Caldilineaceae bacterium]|nr:monovalent cation/H+ antiporter subunit E [Caldilineaceae bacterium]
MSIRLLFVINVALAALWLVLMQSLNLVDALIGFVIGLIIISILEPGYGSRGGRVPVFVLYVLWEVILSSLVVAGYILRRNINVRQGIVAVPMDVTNPMEIATLASVITLTPGTLTVEIGKDEAEDGRRVLFVHALNIDDPHALTAKIKNGFEKQILQITRGGGPA